MAKNAQTYSELVKSVGTVDTEMERDRAGAKIIKGWEQLVKTTASKVIGKKLIVCNRAVKWRDDELKEAIRIRREAHARYIASKNAAGWKEYAKARKDVKKMVEKKRGDMGRGKTNEDFGGGMKQMWVGIKGIMSKRAGKIDKGIATLKAKNGKMVSSSRWKKEVLVEQNRKLGTPKTKKRFDTKFEKEINT